MCMFMFKSVYHGDTDGPTVATCVCLCSSYWQVKFGKKSEKNSEKWRNGPLIKSYIPRRSHLCHGTNVHGAKVLGVI